MVRFGTEGWSGVRHGEVYFGMVYVHIHFKISHNSVRLGGVGYQYGMVRFGKARSGL
jgi:hypothetical protein